jgi:hypothetical protein
MPTDLPLYTLTPTYVNFHYRPALSSPHYTVLYAAPIKKHVVYALFSINIPWWHFTPLKNDISQSVHMHCRAEIKIYLFIILKKVGTVANLKLLKVKYDNDEK